MKQGLIYIQLLCFVLSFSILFAGEDIPYEIKRWVEFDHLYNSASRQGENVKKELQNIRTVYTVDIPKEEKSTWLEESKYIDATTKRRTTIIKNGKEYIRFYLFWDGDIAAAKKAGFDPQPTHRGVLMTSHSTVLVWNPEYKKPDPFFVKMTIKIKNETANGPDQADGAIQLNDVIEKILEKESPLYMPERSAMWTSAWGKPYANVIREIKPLLEKGGSIKDWLPLHGFIGSPLLHEMAKKKNWDADTWIKEEYLPKLADWHARLAYRHGIYPESHSQNLVLRLDESTGEIKSFGFRDAFDTSFDPLPALSRGETPLTKTVLKGGLSYLGKYHVDLKKTIKVGDVTAAYLSQSVHDLLEKNTDKNNAFSWAFTKAYAKAVEKYTGKTTKVEVTPTKDAIVHNMYWSSPDNYGYYADTNRFAAAIQAIHDSWLEQNFKIIPSEQSTYSQSTLHSLFDKKWKEGKVGFLSPWYDVNVTNGSPFRVLAGVYFAYDGKNITAFSGISRTPLAIAYDVTPEEAQEIGEKICGIWAWLNF